MIEVSIWKVMIKERHRRWREIPPNYQKGFKKEKGKAQQQLGNLAYGSPMCHK